MKSSKFWIAVLVAGIIVNILDFVVQANLFESMFYSKMTDVMSMGGDVQWFIIGDFAAVFVFAVVFNRVGSMFGEGIKGGMICGLWLGVFATFPGYMFAHLIIKHYSFTLAWANIIYGIIWYIVAGAVVAALMKKNPAST
jgi:hypothetical protein